MTATITRHRKRKLKADLHVVPYIDVMLVLLQPAGVPKVGLMGQPAGDAR